MGRDGFRCLSMAVVALAATVFMPSQALAEPATIGPREAVGALKGDHHHRRLVLLDVFDHRLVHFCPNVGTELAMHWHDVERRDIGVGRAELRRAIRRIVIELIR